MITNTLFFIVILALIGLVVWREREHARQLKDTMFLKKADRPEEYAHYRSIDDEPKEEPVTEIEINLEDTTLEDWKRLNA